MASATGWSSLWIVDKRTARRAATLAVSACALVATLKLVHFVALLGVPSRASSPVELIDAALFALAAFGIYHLSRLAAIAGFGLYLGAVVLSGTVKFWVFFLVTLCFVSGILATFIYRELEKRLGGANDAAA